MIKCPFCSTSHINNTLFCNECGKYMLEDEKPETDPLSVTDTGWIAKRTNGSGNALSFNSHARSHAIRLKIGGRRREIELPLNKAILMGRTDPASTNFPEVDLTDDGALARSVSRRHARILKRGNTVVVEDLGSINGTFVNGERLAPYLPEILNDGDTLQLGKLQIGVKIQTK